MENEFDEEVQDKDVQTIINSIKEIAIKKGHNDFLDTNMVELKHAYLGLKKMMEKENPIINLDDVSKNFGGDYKKYTAFLIYLKEVDYDLYVELVLNTKKNSKLITKEVLYEIIEERNNECKKGKTIKK